MEIAQLAQATDADFIAALGERLGDLLGAVSDPGAKAAFPVAGLSADRLAARRTALLGEAAHILPPIGAQGLNLGFRDAGALADCVADVLAQGQDPGGAETLDAYAEARRLDVMTRTLGVDLFEPLASDLASSGASGARHRPARAERSCATQARGHADRAHAADGVAPLDAPARRLKFAEALTPYPAFATRKVSRRFFHRN